MTFGLRVRSRARDDIRRARRWYENQSPGVGDRFGQELDSVIARITEQPLLYQKVYRDVRRALTRHFPYAIYFVVTAERVSVLRILHQARSPEEWQRET